MRFNVLAFAKDKDKNDQVREFSHCSAYENAP